MSQKAKIRARFDTELAETSELILKEPDSDRTRKRLKRLLAYKELLDIMPTTLAPEKRVALGIVSASLLAVVVLWWLPHRPVDFSLEARSKVVAIEPASSPVDLGGLFRASQSVTLANLSRIGGPTVGPTPLKSDTGAAQLALSPGRFQLTNLITEDISLVILRENRGATELEIHDGTVSGALVVESLKGLTKKSGAEPDNVEIVRFDRHQTSSAPVTFVFDKAKWDGPLRLDVDGIDFLRHVKVLTADKRFRSALQGGHIRVHEADEEHPIRKGQSLVFEDLEESRLEIKLEDDLVVMLEGRAVAVKLGPAGKEETLNPSLLRYFAKDKNWTLIWAGFLFISGVLWNLRKWFTTEG